ncbi:spermidine/putrescine ABC transporter substrate-binding protein [Oscillatoria sp. FACHB-1406]|uniref:ABC transporter substrate-binding protein n=1 Tax=Oscillatoria sp. FACHB-1406 TaxID=2692846 RepID=UPI001687ADF9|nr:spermidine/putrescine ABC transporter substrate-binding protein [Oscillatoria sp. FACHB-1406]MBD2577564.1 spermidine/putrescine ABC transporter substrate-binding protein [Oscillatoria sp. FACHB-1406]
MKRLLVFLLLFLIGITFPTGCAFFNSKKTDEASANVLSVYNWSTYIDPQAIKDFEKKFNVKVKYDTYESNEDLLAKIRPGNPGYDIIVPSSDYVAIMGSEGLLEPLNHQNIPNIKNLSKRFIDPPFDRGNRYSVPYQWGTMGLGYNIKKIGGELSSWGDIFEPRFAGRVSLMEDLRATLGVILIYLGYEPNSSNIEEIRKARDFLIKHQEVIAAFAPDTGQNLLDQGEVDIAVEWSGDIFQIAEENEDIRYAIPKEGTIIWTDNLAIPAGAPHKELAEKFINFVLEPEVGAKISNFVKYGSPNQAAIDGGFIEKEDLENPEIYPTPDIASRLKYADDIGKATELYDDAWTEVKVAMSNSFF